MRRIRSYSVCTLSVLLSVCISSCNIMDDVMPTMRKSSPVTVAISAGSPQTRTSLLPDGLTTAWSEGDELVVWALDQSGTYALSAQDFSVYATDGGRAWFTSKLESAMPDGTYTYLACYPAPAAVSGTTATFEISDTQDGKASMGNDVLVADPVSFGPLTPIHDPDDHVMMSMSLRHIMHHFRFFIPEGMDPFDGEAIERIELTFPEDVVGDVLADIGDPDAALSLANGSSQIVLELAEPLLPSTASAVKYADAVLFPRNFEAGQSLGIRAYSSSKIGTTDPVDLRGKSFEGGHSTPVRLLFTKVWNNFRFNIRIAENNLGEDPVTITLTAPEGCRWGDDGSNVLVLSDAAGLPVDYSYELSFEEEDYFRAFSNQSIHVVFDSEHVTTSVDYLMPDMSSRSSVSLDLGLPYLLYEDFSSVGTFSSSDNYSGGFNSGSKDAVTFLNGWSGGRIGASEGKCVRIAARRETSARYGARVDSAPIMELKSPANLRVRFDYGINSQFGGVALGANGDVGQDCYIGYITTSDNLGSGSTDGTFESANHINAHVFTGSYDETPEVGDFVLHDVPSGLVRISWRNLSENRAGTTNTTNWFYLDNVRVSIAK